MSRDYPYFPFYPEDYAAGTRGMTPTAKGIYMDCICHQWSHGFLPEDQDEIARICGASVTELESAWCKVSKKFVKVSEGRLQNARLEKERAKLIDAVKRRTKAGRKGAKARWQTHSDRNATALPTQCDSPCDSDGKPMARAFGCCIGSDSKTSFTVELPEILDTEAFRLALTQWLEYKKERRESYKPAGLKSLIASAQAKAERHGVEAVIEAMRTAAGNGWQGWDQKSLFGAPNGSKQSNRVGPGQRFRPSDR